MCLTLPPVHGNAPVMAEETPKQRTWGGRFGSKPDELMTRINASIGFDKRLWREDIAASKAHAAMLREQGIIPAADASALRAQGVAAVFTPKDFAITAIIGRLLDEIRRAHHLQPWHGPPRTLAGTS